MSALGPMLGCSLAFTILEDCVEELDYSLFADMSWPILVT